MPIQDLGQLTIQVGDGMTGIVGSQANGHPVVHVGPFGMVVHRLNQRDCGEHESNGPNKAIESIFLHKGIIRLDPAEGLRCQIHGVGFRLRGIIN